MERQPSQHDTESPKHYRSSSIPEKGKGCFPLWRVGCSLWNKGIVKNRDRSESKKPAWATK